MLINGQIRKLPGIRGTSVRNQPFRIEALARPDLVRPLAEIVSEYIERAMVLCGGDRQLAAKRLGVANATVYRYVKDFRSQDEQTKTAAAGK